VHVVTHRAWPDLRGLPSLTVHEVWRPFGRHLLGGPMLSWAGHQAWRHLGPRGVHAVVNGGNCRMAGANWVHYVHAAYKPEVAASGAHRAKGWFTHQRDVAAEREALRAARVVICNSRRTARDVVAEVGVDAARVAVVYYGVDANRFARATAAERERTRRRLGKSGDRPLVGFVGALGDRRKAFDTLFAAWTDLCRRTDWDADLVVVGSGAELESWRARAEAVGVSRRMTFLGFRSDVPEILAGLDALVHPARYEAYGLSVHEAICRGLPALVTASAGVAERYPEDLRDLLLDDPDDPGELGSRLWQWRSQADQYRARTASFSQALRARSWDVMSQEIVELVEQAA
jgi:glycosyltransferase involved in cell wall biosynthesis